MRLFHYIFHLKLIGRAPAQRPSVVRTCFQSFWSFDRSQQDLTPHSWSLHNIRKWLLVLSRMQWKRKAAEGHEISNVIQNLKSWILAGRVPRKEEIEESASHHFGNLLGSVRGLSLGEQTLAVKSCFQSFSSFDCSHQDLTPQTWSLHFIRKWLLLLSRIH